MSIKYLDLQSSIDKSHDSEKQNKDDVSLILKESDILYKKVMCTKNGDLINNYHQAQNELYESIIEAVTSENSISKTERIKIMLELGDLVNITEEAGISDKFNCWRKFTGFISGRTEKKVNAIGESSLEMFDMDIEKYSKQDAMGALEYLNDNLGNYHSSTLGGRVTEGLESVGFTTKTLNDIDTQEEAKVFQDYLINKITGGNEGFGNGFIKGHNNKKGNYLVTIENFENEFTNKSVADVDNKTDTNPNSKYVNVVELKHYLLFLKSTVGLTKEVLLQRFGSDKLDQLQYTLTHNKNSILTSILDQEQINSISKYTNKALLDIQNNKLNTNVDLLSNDIFMADPSLIKLITDKSKLQQVVEYIQNKKPEQKLLLQQVPDDFQNDTWILQHIPIIYDDISIFEESDYKDLDFIHLLLENNPSLVTLIIPIALRYHKSVQLLTILKSLASYDINYIDKNIINLLNEKNGFTEKFQFNRSVEKFVNGKNTLKDIDTINYFLLSNKTQKIEEQVVRLIKAKYSYPMIHMHYCTVNTAKAVLEAQPYFGYFIKKDLLHNPKILALIVKKAQDTDQMLLILNRISFNNINELLFLYKTLKDEKPNDYKDIWNKFLGDSNMEYQIIPLFEAAYRNGYNNKYTSEYKEIKTFADRQTEQIAFLVKSNQKIQEKIISIKNNPELHQSDAIQLIVNNSIKKINSLLGNEKINESTLELLITNFSQGETAGMKRSFDILKKEVKDDNIAKEILNILGSTNLDTNLIKLQTVEKKTKEAGLNQDQILTNFEIYRKKNPNKDGLTRVEYVTKFTEQEIINQDTKKGELISQFITQKWNTIEATNIGKNIEKLHELHTKGDEEEFGVAYEKLVNHNIVPNLNIDFTHEYERINTTVIELYIQEQQAIETQKENQQQKEELEPTSEKQIVKSVITLKDKRIIENTPGHVTIQPIHGEPFLITQTDINAINNNSENLDNIISCYETFEKVGISNLWKHKDSLLGSLQNVHGLGFKVDEDYLNKNEMKILLESVLVSVGENISSNNFDDTVAQFEIINNRQIGGNQAEVGYNGNSKIEELFIQQFLPKNSALGFKKSAFEEALA